MKRRTKTKERRFPNRRGIHGGVASALPWVLTVAAIALFVLAAVARGAEETRILTAHWVLDVERGELIENGVVVIGGDRIAAVVRKGEVTPKSEVLDLGEATLMPGMIDAHVHLLLAGPGEANAKATLKAGFTTVQDLGALNYANIKIRNAIRDGKFPGPRVVSSGPWLGVSKGTCDFQGIGVQGPEEFRARVKKDVAEEADLIKVCASGWLEDAAKQPDSAEISEEALQAAIEQAHALKRRVAVHAISERAIALSVTHGADLIAHGGFTSKATVAEMAKRRVYQIPTLFSLKASVSPEVYEKLQKHLAAAIRDGLPIAFGTDAGVIKHGENAKEFVELAALGLKPIDAIRTATLEAANAVGLSGQIGTLKTGAFADIIAVEGNPLTDLTALQKVKFVMKAGRPVDRNTL
ncbi:MAG TPA: amidohydrolase family protein [Chthoniobacterales bacterium]|nr:amidohydrolase family protein [Chthoniobacterales bacterium]